MYQEAQPYQVALRRDAKTFLGALQQAGFSLEGILNGVPEQQYVNALTTDTAGKQLAASHPLFGTPLNHTVLTWWSSALSGFVIMTGNSG